VKGERLRTIKMRGQVSQGLILPLSVVHQDDTHGNVYNLIEGTDVSDILNIKKWEAPIPAQLVGEIRGGFPGFLRKTDQERVQNLVSTLEVWKNAGFTWEVTEKLDGSSMTVYSYNGDVGVCSRNIDLKENETNSFWNTARNAGIIDKIKALGRNIAIQGELIGEGIQKNKYKIAGQDFFAFDVFDIDTNEYLSPIHRIQLLDSLQIKRVPIIYSHKEFNPSVNELLQFAEGTSKLYNTEREGVVFKCNEARISFKAISNKFLLKEGE
jgi:RNA ligase (TIGR02306 family)